jgi:SLT domain-containing protein
MRLTGVPDRWFQGLMTIASRESGFNPRAINLWDSNAAKGTPSIGLMQTIMPTFLANALPGLGDIYNPVHNAVAAIRYILARYGDISNVKQADPNSAPRGYENGGLISNESLIRVAERNKPELVVPLTKPGRALDLLNKSGLSKMVLEAMAGEGGEAGRSVPAIGNLQVDVKVEAPKAEGPGAYASAMSHRIGPQVAGAVVRALGG